MKCNLCHKNDAEIIQSFDYDGIEKKIGYCHKCIKDIVKFHISPVNNKILKIYNTNVFFKNNFPFKKDNIELKNIRGRILIELPVSIKRMLFVEDDNSTLRDAQAIIKRGLDYWQNEYEKAKEEYNTEKMKAIEDIIKKIKKLL
ncbi:hypothetical protein [Marinitoga aeolica]|uniref:Uncharacterized protein n=1 Tax=Marinitoga aeolica TaxID=2809031 RepID=A0ABY8PRL9_9BACT|nr:hypothetical protein [Marinitoga aeolica]WGS65284.1 hypothetical protein JRV97_01645 [Marinitoga aeolica]